MFFERACAVLMIILSCSITLSQGQQTKPNVIGSCGGQFFGQNGSIASPGFPTDNYPDNIRCVYEIEVDPGYNIVYQVTYLNTQTSLFGLFCNDFLSIRINSTHVRNLCGSRGFPAEITEGRNLTVVFSSDPFLSLDGFAMTWYALNISSFDMNFDCNFEEILACNGWLQSQNDDFDWSIGRRSFSSNIFGNVIGEVSPFNDRTTGLPTGSYGYINPDGSSWNDTAVFISPEVSTNGTQYCLEFWYRNFGGGQLKVILLQSNQLSEGEVIWLNDEAAGGSNWIRNRLNFSPSDLSFQIGFEAVRGESSSSSDIAIDDISLNIGSCIIPIPELNCSFDGIAYLCEGWSQSREDDADWSFERGPTASLNTGPPADHTTGIIGVGGYAYLEGTGLIIGDQALLLSPLINSSSGTGQAYCLEFWLHNMGVGSLDVLTIYENSSNRTLRSFTSQTGGLWIRRRINIRASVRAFKIGFHATRGNLFESDIAIDDVLFHRGLCRSLRRNPLNSTIASPRNLNVASTTTPSSTIAVLSSSCHPSLQFMCQSTGQCISQAFVCDDLSDCPDSSDEANCAGTGNNRPDRTLGFGPSSPTTATTATTPAPSRITPTTIQASQSTPIASSSCDPSLQFMCQSTGQCISQAFVCDDLSDCPDSSDEANCAGTGNNRPDRTLGFGPSSPTTATTATTPAPSRITPTTIQASQSTPIASSSCDPSLQFMCQSTGQCISQAFVCDDLSDCPDSSDEANCAGTGNNRPDRTLGFGPSSPTTATTATTPAPSRITPTTIQASQSTPIASSSCDPSLQFMCQSTGQCISQAFVCDDLSDCPDSSDEANCAGTGNNRPDRTLGFGPSSSTTATTATTPAPSRITPTTTQASQSTPIASSSCDPSLQFMCQSTGQCISQAFVCDGLSDCPDSSDEANCAGTGNNRPDRTLGFGPSSPTTATTATTPAPSRITPTTIQASQSTPIASSSCDPSLQFMCQSTGQCISQAFVCDDLSDCPDSSDEANCAGTGNNRPDRTLGFGPSSSTTATTATTPAPSRITPTTTQASQSTPIASSSCDPSLQFMCQSTGQCISQAFVCDGLSDCPDSSDEANCAGTGNNRPDRTLGFGSSSPTTATTATTLSPSRITPTTTQASQSTQGRRELTCSFDETSYLCQGWNQSREDDADWSFQRGSTPSQGTGPSADRTTGTNAGGYAYLEGTGLQPGDNALLLSPVIDSSRQGHCVEFWVHNVGVGSLNVLMVYENGTNRLLSSITFETRGLWRMQQFFIPSSSGDFKIGFEATRGNNFRSDIAIDDVRFASGVCNFTDLSCEPQEFLCPEGRCISQASVCDGFDDCLLDKADERNCSEPQIIPSAIQTNVVSMFNCSFDESTQLCTDWSQSLVDNLDWTFHRGSTPSSNTGPSIDHTTGTAAGGYAYLEGTGINPGDTAILLSPSLDSSDEQYCLEFWIHNVGVGSLNLSLVYENGTNQLLRSFIQNTGNVWQRQELSISASPGLFKIGFEAIRGRSFQSDIALDDVQLVMGSCDNTNPSPVTAAPTTQTNTISKTMVTTPTPLTLSTSSLENIVSSTVSAARPITLSTSTSDNTVSSTIVPSTGRTSCKAILQSMGAGSSSMADGVHYLEDANYIQYPAYCDMSTDGGGWTLVASIHEDNIRITGRCAGGDRWSSQYGNERGSQVGAENWMNYNTFGKLYSATSDDYKNQAYFQLQARDVMIWQVPNNTPLATYNTSSVLKYHTTDGFLTRYGGNLFSLYGQHFPIRSGIFNTNSDNGPAIPVTFDKGNANDVLNQLGPNSRRGVEPGYIQFRAINGENSAYALCPGIRAGSNFRRNQHVCIGSTADNTERRFCGDFAGLSWNQYGTGRGWNANITLIESTFFVFYR